MSTASPSPPIYRARYRATNVVHHGESASSSSSDDDDEKDDDVGDEDVPWRTRGREDEKRGEQEAKREKKEAHVAKEIREGV